MHRVETEACSEVPQKYEKGGSIDMALLEDLAVTFVFKLTLYAFLL